MGLFGHKQKGHGLIDVIRCDEPSYLIWKWHPAGSIAGQNRRENSIRWGSSLRVKDGEVAVFVYNQDNEFYQDSVVGPFDDILKTDNLPVISNIIGLAYAGGTPFQAEVYFINLAKIIQVRFGVPFFDVFDPRFTDFGVPVAVRGSITFSIADYDEFIKLHRLSTFSLDDFHKQIRDSVIRYVKAVVANTPATHNIPVIQLESKIDLINDEVEYYISQRLKENFGVIVSGVDIGEIEIDKYSNGYAKLMAVTQNLSTDTMKAQAAVNIKQMQDKQRIEAEDYADTLRIQREEAQYAQHKQTQTTNFATYQTEAQAQVGIAGAEALGKMGASGGSAVDRGSGSFNPVAMMAGMAMGGAIGQNIASTINNVMSGINQPVQPGTVPPPIPTTAYHVVINGQSAGPFDTSALQKMATDGQLSRDSLVWCQGMADWTKISEVNALSSICSSIPPEIKQ